MSVLQPSRWPPLLRVALPAVALPGAVTALAVFPLSTSTAALAYVLAVTGAAALGGSISGLAASFVSFLTLNFFFTPPRYTFSVRKAEDVVALAVFLLVAIVVGTLLSSAIAQRMRVERREREARLLQFLGTRLLSGDSPATVLNDFGDALMDLVELARYEVLMRDRVEVAIGSSADPGLHREEFPIAAGSDPIGAIKVFSTPDGPGLGEDGRRLVKAFSSQLGLAMESARLGHVAQEAQVEAERSRLQAGLLQSVTHDLRTPLASITASVTGLLAPDVEVAPGARTELLETISQEAERLDRLVGNLLDLSRLRAGALTPSKRLGAIEEVIEGVLARMEPVLRGHPLNLVLRENLPEVPLDVVQIDQALTNILENAAKYSSPGSQITVSAARWENNVQVRIADRGPGIPVDLRQGVFEPFFRAAEGSEGTGLGLAIAHAVVTAHGGSIWIENAPGGGTAVVFQLPINGR